VFKVELCIVTAVCESDSEKVRKQLTVDCKLGSKKGGNVAVGI
jgi:hypothetical protein